MSIKSDKTIKKENRKVLLIGLDGASPILIEKWTRQNKLPNLKRLMENGVYGRLMSTIPPLTAPAWSTFMTGKNPGKHGMYDFVQREERSYNLTRRSPSSREGKTIWELTGEHGMKVGVFNIPLTYPPSEVNGFMVTGFLTPGEGEYTYPPSLKEDLDRRVDGYETFFPEQDAERNPERFLNGLYNVTIKQFRSIIYLMEKYDWDLLCMNFQGIDLIQHKMWHHMDPSHPKHDENFEKKYGNSIAKFYQKLDEIIGVILKKVDKNNTFIIIFSDHGAGKAKKFIYVNVFLKDIGLLKFKHDLTTLVKLMFFKIGFTPTKIYKLLTKFGLLNFVSTKIGKTRASKLKLAKKIFLSFSDVDWKKTKAYSIGHIGQIYLNVEGREPLGSVSSGREYAAVREYVIEKLESLCDPESGERIIDKIYKREEIYKGPYEDRGPDICFLSKDLEYLGFGDCEFASNTALENCFDVTGNHKLNGVILLHGNGINSKKNINNASLEDIAPTVLYYLGMPIPNDMDGSVLKEAFSTGFLKRNPIMSIDVSKIFEEEKKLERRYSKEGEEEIRERLRKLGYLG